MPITALQPHYVAGHFPPEREPFALHSLPLLAAGDRQRRYMLTDHSIFRVVSSDERRPLKVHSERHVPGDAAGFPARHLHGVSQVLREEAAAVTGTEIEGVDDGVI